MPEDKINGLKYNIEKAIQRKNIFFELLRKEDDEK